MNTFKHFALLLALVCTTAFAQPVAGPRPTTAGVGPVNPWPSYEVALMFLNIDMPVYKASLVGKTCKDLLAEYDSFTKEAADAAKGYNQQYAERTMKIAAVRAEYDPRCGKGLTPTAQRAASKRGRS